MKPDDLLEAEERPEATSTEPTRLVLELLRSFPCLRAKFTDWNPSKFRPDTFAAMLGGSSRGEILCGLFILNVWNPTEAIEKGWTFDILEFAGTADGANRRAIAAWLMNPTWP